MGTTRLPEMKNKLTNSIEGVGWLPSAAGIEVGAIGGAKVVDVVVALSS